MATKDDGGPAFPVLQDVQQYDDDRGTYVDSYQPMGGMSLRDYFAAKAVAGILASPQFDRSKPTGELARNCYDIADAMLAERVK